MKSISKVFEQALLRRLDRGYPNLYVAVDLHGTILIPTRETKFFYADGGDTPREQWYSCNGGLKAEKPYLYAFETLKLITRKYPYIKLILWTSGKPEKANQFVLDLLVNEGIRFWYINENPDFPGNEYADFSKKFCFDILLDDKAGFDPKIDWLELYNFLEKYPVDDSEMVSEEAKKNDEKFIEIAKKNIEKYKGAWKELAK